MGPRSSAMIDFDPIADIVTGRHDLNRAKSAFTDLGENLHG